VHDRLLDFGCKTIGAGLLIQLRALEVLLMKVNVYSNGHFTGGTAVHFQVIATFDGHLKNNLLPDKEDYFKKSG
jgi:hypothetical protein